MAALLLPALGAGPALRADDLCSIDSNTEFFGNYWVHKDRYGCTSASRHTVANDAPATLVADAFRTRLTGRLSGGPDVLDVTIDTLRTLGSPLDDPAVRAALAEARQAMTTAAGYPITISGPRLVTASSAHVTAAPVAIRTSRDTLTWTRAAADPAGGDYCVGDLGDLPAPPLELTRAPCPASARRLRLGSYSLGSTFYVSSLVVNNAHTRTDTYRSALLTGTLDTSHYELIGHGGTLTGTVPIVLSSEGLGGASYTSELALTNRGETAVSLTYRYSSAFGGASGSATDTLPAGTQRIIPDAIAYLRGLGVPLGDSGSRGGTLQLTFEDLTSPDAAGATVRTTTTVPEGRAGVAYASLAPSRLLTHPVTIPGLRQDGLDRSNVAVLNAGSPGDGDLTLRLTVVSGDPDDPRTQVLPDVTLSPGGFRQLSGVLSMTGLRNGTVTVERISGLAPFYAYGVINDEANGDGSFVEPARTNPPARIPRMTLPVVVESPDYDTELVLTNLTAASRVLRLELVPTTPSGGSGVLTVSLRPHEQQILPGFVQLLRDRGVLSGLRGRTIAGPLFATDATGDLRGVSIAARATTPGGGGRYGLFYAAVPSGGEATSSAWLFDLQQNDETRTNLALVNVGSVDATASSFRIDLFDGATGKKAGSTEVTVPASGFLQLDAVLSRHAPGVTQGYALVTRTAGSNPFLAFATVLDGAEPGKRSGDGAFVAAVVPDSR